MNNKVLEIALGKYGIDRQGKSFPWCADFINEVLREAEIEGTNSLLARSFLDLGEPTSTPKIGDIVVLWRISPDSIFGHAGFYIKEDKEHVWILGGNQDGVVKIKAYPMWQLIAYRHLNA